MSRGLAPRSVIIHRSGDRGRYPWQLRAALGNCRHQEAICPDWDAARDNNAIRGCSLAHLRAYRTYAKGRPLLVLEDDAEPVHAPYADWLAIPALPADCGAVLLGGDIRRYRRREDGWIQVFDFCGTQAVVYNTPLLDTSEFLVHAYEWIASHKMGPHGPGADEIGSCYEQVLWYSLQKCGLKVYCREDHAFTTAAMTSTRSHLPMHPRAMNIHQETPSHCGTPPQEQ